MIRRPPRSTQSRSSAASDVYKRQEGGPELPTLWGARARPLIGRGREGRFDLLLGLVSQFASSHRHRQEILGWSERACPPRAVRARCVVRVVEVEHDVTRAGCDLEHKAIGVLCGRDEHRAVSYTHLRAHETRHDLVCRLLLEKKKKKKT